jgi:3-deoxy-D-manno-octulosonic-acid transferase
MIWLYRVLFVPVLVLLAPHYAARMRRRGGYGRNFGERFGAHRPPPRVAGRRRVWLQAVSVGEMLAIAPLLEGLRRDGVDVYLTTTTSTGYRLAQERYAGLAVGIGYFPIDWWPFAARAWRLIQPDLVILTEGERWPEHLQQARTRSVPVLCINARLSDRGFARLRRLGPLSALVFDGVTRVLPGSRQDEARFRELGVSADRIIFAGNLKFDVEIPRISAEEAVQLRRELGLGQRVLVLGSSTWPGEEAALLAAWRRWRSDGMDVGLLLVPRHAERRPEIERLLVDQGVAHHFRSRGSAPGPVEVAVADTTGELRRLTQLADVVVVGKSLPPHTEGQTPVEAAALEKPIAFGPGMANFRVIADDLVRRGAARRLAGEQDLYAGVAELLMDAQRRAELARAAADWRRENAGATVRTLAVIRAELAALR